MAKILPRRIESKFVVPLAHTIALDTLLKHFPQAKRTDYQVHSLYYDTMDLRSYHQKKNGDYHRKKFRLRYYNESSSRPIVEIKEKKGQIVEKHREIVSDFSSFSFPQLFAPLSEKITENDLRSGFSPILWTIYQRSAFDLSSKPYFRITIDSQISFGQFNSRLDNIPAGPMFPDLVVELKHVPDFNQKWLKLVSNHLEAYKSNFSKFAWALETGKRENRWI